MLSKGFDAAHLTFIQRFEFPEPVFFPESLKRSGFFIFKKEEYGYLSNPILLISAMESMMKDDLGEIGVIKPVKNLKTGKDNFWQEFSYHDVGALTGLSELPYYPFQIIPEKLKLKEDRDYIEAITGMKIADSKMDTQIRLFPCGVGTAHLYLYIKPEQMDAEKLVRLTSSPKNIRIIQKGKRKDAYQFFNDFVNMVMNRISNRKTGRSRIIRGYYLLVNLQGRGLEKLSREDAEDFSRILENRIDYSGEKDIKEIVKRKDLKKKRREKDYIFVSPKTAILFADEEIRSIGHDKILKGRRCFRGHVLNTLEMAYNMEHLLRLYSSFLDRRLKELIALEMKRTPLDKLRKAMITTVFDDRVYKTLVYTIIPLRENLIITGRLYAKIFRNAFIAMNLGKSLNEMRYKMNCLYEKAREWNAPSELLEVLYEKCMEIGELAASFVPKP